MVSSMQLGENVFNIKLTLNKIKIKISIGWFLARVFHVFISTILITSIYIDKFPMEIWFVYFMCSMVGFGSFHKNVSKKPF